MNKFSALDSLQPSPKIFTRILLDWYIQNGRDLPWRKTKNPYEIWVSEVMLQQTQVERVKDYYKRFLQRFPDLDELAKADWEEVLEQWRGLGYYRRARNLHAAAQLVLKDHNGVMPQDYRLLRKLPGVGAYTAGAIASFAFDQDIPAIDTNVEEVFQHVFGAKSWQSLKPLERYRLVRSFIPLKQSADFHHALMDLGTALKTNLKQDHNQCPFQTYCKIHVLIDEASASRGLTCASNSKKILNSSREQGFVKKVPLNKASLIKVAIGVLIHKGKILITQRKAGDSFGGYWEFPGGKYEPGETARSCLKREMQEELGIEVSVRPPFYVTEVTYNDKSYFLSFHRCSLLLGKVQALESAAYKWIKPEELLHYTFPPANKPVLELLLQKKGMFRG